MMIRATLMYSPAPRTVFEETVVIGHGATVETVVRTSRLRQEFPTLEWRSLTPGIWGKAVPWERGVIEGDRVELCRPLLVDPKVARRERFQRQGARATGLFARRREGGKAGY